MECIRPVPLENGNKEFAIRIPLLGSKQMLKVKETLKDGCGKVDRAISSNTSGESYKQFMLVIYESRVVIWGILKSGTTLES